MKTFFTSIGMALVLVSLMMFLVFRDAKVALLSMLPNIVPLSFGAALMTILDKPIDIGTAIVSSVCLGISVDDTIHFIANYQNNLNSGMSTPDSIQNVFGKTGSALVVTTLLLVVGFGSFSFGNFIPNRNFGILCSLILTMALITDLILLPAILLRLAGPNDISKSA